MSGDQLSTVQILWRDRREEFEAYLNGEIDCFHGNNLCPATLFGEPASKYTFHPKPKPPQLRPLTRDEWIDRRDWWIREKGADRIQRIVIINAGSIESDYCKWDFNEALDDAEMSLDCIHWQPCGIPDSEVTE